MLKRTNFTSNIDQSYQATVLNVADQEAKLSNFQDELGSWHSLISQYVTVNYMTTNISFHNNGVFLNLWNTLAD